MGAEPVDPLTVGDDAPLQTFISPHIYNPQGCKKNVWRCILQERNEAQAPAEEMGERRCGNGKA